LRERKPCAERDQDRCDNEQEGIALVEQLDPDQRSHNDARQGAGRRE
jgi:hypothetical protein